MAIDWEDIQSFYQVVEAGSFSEAARRFDTTQATVSRRIKSLEGELGVTLFQRTHSGSDITLEGMRLCRAAARMHAGFEEFQKAHREILEEGRTLTITCGGLIGLFLSANLARLSRGLKGVDIEIKTTAEFLDIERGEADLALRNRRPSKGALKSKKLVAPEYGPFSIFGNVAFYKGKRLSIAQARREPWASYGARSAALPSMRWLDKHIGKRAVKFRVNSPSLLLEVINENRALALLPRFFGRKGMGRMTAGMVEVHGPVEELFFDMWVVRRASSDEDEQLLRLIANIERLFV